MSNESAIPGEFGIEADPVLVINELRHRAGNRFAVLQAVVSQTFRTARTLAEAKRTLERRIVALRSVEDMRLTDHPTDVDLGSLIVELVYSYVGSETHRFRISGPAVVLPARSGFVFSLALNELATNAVKYGALSNHDGTVDVTWEFEPKRMPSRLNLFWCEKDGPPVHPPQRTGLGTALVKRAMATEPGGYASVHFLSGGVQWILCGG